jgi:translocator protein
MSNASARPVHRVPSWASWLGFVVLCNAVGFTSSLFAGEPTIYRELVRPAWAPPPVVFAPVWTALYTMMGTATWLVFTRVRDRSPALQILVAQLVTNFLWTPIFFGLQRYGLAVVVIVANWIAVLAMMIVYFRKLRMAGWLVAPLLAWVSFAAALNVSIWWLNR